MKYKALPRNGEVDAEVALLQGANALDAAGIIAETSGDVEGLLNIAAMWMKMGEAFQQYAIDAESLDGKVIKIDDKFKTGFQCAEPDIAVEEDDDAGD